MFRWPEKRQTSEFSSVPYILTQCLYQPEYWATVLLPPRNQFLRQPDEHGLPCSTLTFNCISNRKNIFWLINSQYTGKGKRLTCILHSVTLSSVRPSLLLIWYIVVDCFTMHLHSLNYMYIDKHIEVCLCVYVHTYTQTFFVVTSKTMQYVSLGISWLCFLWITYTCVLCPPFCQCKEFLHCSL